MLKFFPVHLIPSLAMMVAVIGCAQGDGPKSPANMREVNAWTITDLRADHGHDTLEAEDGGMFHNYFCAVVLEKNYQSVSLLYENELPENLELKLGHRYHIDGLDTATYSNDWRGYWLHDVNLRPANSGTKY